MNDETAAETAASGLVLPGFRITRRIGRGGFSVVHEAIQLSLGRAVAIKVLHADMSSAGDRRRFDRERELLGKLGGHRNVVDVFDAGVSRDGRPYIVMRLYRGGTLGDLIERNGALDLPATVDVVEGIAAALDVAHAMGVVHRDVTPANVMFDDDSVPVLADFGIAALAARDQATTMTAFTRMHAAPEVLEGEGYSIASDVYSLASTTYQMLASHGPFSGMSGPRQMLAVLNDPIPPLGRDDLPAELDHILRKALAKQPEQRYASAGEFARALADVVAHQQLPEPRMPRTSPDVPLAEDHPANAVTVRRLPDADRPPVTTGDASAKSRARRLLTSGRALTILTALLAVVLVAGTLGAGYAWARSRYSLVIRNGHVAVLQGVEASPFGVDLASYRTTDVDAALLPEDERARLVEHVTVDGDKGADAAVRRLRSIAERCLNDLSGDCPPRPLQEPTVTAAASTYPKGNEIFVSWTGVDQRKGTATTLLVDSEPPPSSCPRTISESGSCRFQVAFGRELEVSALVTGPAASPSIRTSTVVKAYPKPAVKVYPGPKFTDDDGTFCSILVDVRGLAPTSRYPVTLRFADGDSVRRSIETDDNGAAAGADVGWGARDSDGSFWVQATIEGVKAIRKPWGCA
jgi:hypothetical protein